MGKLIIPPKDIRVIIEKTAGFVAKNGSEFEAKIHENERHNPKFAFMSPNDPYNMFYRKRLQELIEGGQDAIMKAITDSKASEAQASSFMDQSGESVETEEKEISVLNEFNLDNLDFLVELPTISALDLDVLKLTAQFAAKNGKQFILHLSQKESRNPQFDFLKPHNHLHSIYQTLVKQYTLVLNPPSNLLERVKRCAFNKSDHLKLVQKRSQIERLERQRIQEEEAEQNAEKEAFNIIDWHDFSIAETVTFGPEDQHKDFPVPLNPQTLQSMPITQRLEMWTGRRSEVEAVDSAKFERFDEEMEIDEPGDFSTPIIMPAANRGTNEIIMGAAFGSGGAPIKVRTDYVPRASVNQSVPIQICEICKAAIPVNQIDEHIRIELLDPKWRTQRLAMMSKNRESNLVETGTDVSRNLEAIAKHRSDIFSPSAGSASASIERGPTRPIWDGRADSVGQINRAAQIFAKPQIEKEMEALQRTEDYSLDPSKGIGPRQNIQNSQPSQNNHNIQTGQTVYPQSQGYPIPLPPYTVPPMAYPPMQGYPPFMPPNMPPLPPGGFNPAMFPPGQMMPPPFPPGIHPPQPPPKDEKK